MACYALMRMYYIHFINNVTISMGQALCNTTLLKEHCECLSKKIFLKHGKGHNNFFEFSRIQNVCCPVFTKKK